MGCPQFSVDVQKVLALLEVLGCIELRVFSAGRMEKVGAAPRPYRGPMAPKGHQRPHSDSNGPKGTPTAP